MNAAKRATGFTLTELMFVVVILGILASIAIPNYSDYVTRARRSDGMASLEAASTALAKFRANNGFTYGGASLAGGAGTVVFANQVPATGTAYYTLALDQAVLPAGATAYTLTATPVGAQLGNDGRLTITSTGVKTWTDRNNVVHNCWPTSPGC